MVLSPHRPTQLDAAPCVPDWLASADNRTLPVSPRRMRATLHYAVHPWYRVPKALILLAGRSCRGCWCECSYIWEGGLRVIDAVAEYQMALHHEKAAKAAVGTKDEYHARCRHINARRSRGILIGIALGAVGILALWLGLAHPRIGELAGVGLVTALDAIGRRGQPPKIRTKPPKPLQEGMPNGMVWGQISAFLQTDPKLASAVRIYDVQPDKWRKAYNVGIRTEVDIKAGHLHSLEKWLRVFDGACSITTDPMNSADKTITILLSKPLQNVGQAPWIPAGSMSGWQPLDLGESSNRDIPFELVMVMRHMMLVSATFGGKTTHLHNIIDRLSACRDVVVCTGDVGKNLGFDSWRSVIYKKADSVLQLEEMLQWALDEIYRRCVQIRKINSDDDPNNDIHKWNPSLGPAVVLIIDEWPAACTYDGTKRIEPSGHKPNILYLAEQIVKMGNGLGVSMILACQGSGNRNWGSSEFNKQTTTKIIGPCSESDTVVLLGVDKRDAGWSPHLLQTADERGPNDAGMAVVSAPGFGPNYVRGYAPFESVKARAIRREQEWAKYGNRPVLAVEAKKPTGVITGTLPPALSAVDAAMRHHAVDTLSSALVVEYANNNGGCWTQENLATALKQEIVGNEDGVIIKSRGGHCGVNKTTLRCYYRTDVDQAMRVLEM